MAMSNNPNTKKAGGSSTKGGSGSGGKPGGKK